MRTLSKNLGCALEKIVLATLTAACLQAAPAQASRVWGEGHFATAYVGADPKDGSPVRMQLQLVAVGPDKVEPASVHDRYASCLRDSVVAVVSSADFWERLDKNVRPWTSIPEDLSVAGVGIDAKSITSARIARQQQVGQVFASAYDKYMAGVRSCGLPAPMLAATKLAMVPRVCMQRGGRPCSGQDYLRNPTYLSAYRFGKVFEWFLSAGARRENEFLEIGSGASLAALATPTELYVEKGKFWPKSRTPEEAQIAFEKGAVELRKQKLKYDYIAPRAVGLTKDTALRLMDVIAHPAFSVPLLPVAAPGAAPLLTIQDEIARTRIAECVKFKGATGADAAAAVAACAGYEVDKKMLISCMTAQECLPKMALIGDASVLARLSPGQGSELVTSLLPRIAGTVPPQAYGQYKKAGEECRKLAPAQASICLAKVGLGDKARASMDCASNVVAGKGGSSGAARCAADMLPQGPGRKLAECAASTGVNDHKALAFCVVKTRLPPVVQDKLPCLAKPTKDQVAACLGKDVGGEIGKLATCWDKFPNQYNRAGLCVVDNSSVSEDVKQVVACATSAQGATGFAVCAGAKNLGLKNIGGDGGKLLNCAAQTGGDGMGTLACMTDGQLNPEQQIALQCAAQSAELVTFAVCTGGQLSMREFAKCQGKRFGEDPCFGKNNEIRKTLLAVGVDVGENTVLGQVANAHLDVFKAQVAFAESAGGVAVKFAGDMVKAAQSLGEAFVQGVGSVVQAGKDLIKGLGNAIGANISW